MVYLFVCLYVQKLSTPTSQKTVCVQNKDKKVNAVWEILFLLKNEQRP